MKHLSEIKMGVFAISGLLLLVFGWAYLREFAVQQQHYFTVVFDDVAGLTKGSFVRINGLRVGRVDTLTLDTKENKVLVQARIQLSDINIPKDSKMFIRTSGYVGDKFLEVVLGMSSEYVMDGDILPGEKTFDSFKSLEVISEIIEQVDPKLVGMNIQDVTTGASELIKKADKVVEGLPKGQELTRLVNNAHDTVDKLNSAIEKAQGFANDEVAQANLTKVLSQASIVSNDLREAIKNANNLANNKAAYENVSTLLLRASKIIEQLDEIRSDPIIQNDLRQTLDNANLAAKKFAFTSDEVSMALNQRFILPRLLFGKLLPSKKKVDERK